MEERLIDIVTSCKNGVELNQKYRFYNLIGRYRTIHDSDNLCLWMYLGNVSNSPEPLRAIGKYVNRDSALGKKILNSDLGVEFEFKAGKDYHGRLIDHKAKVLNMSDFANRTIRIAGNPVLYTYDNLSDFLLQLQQADQAIINNEEKTRQLEEQKRQEADAHRRGVIQKEINQLKDAHLALTHQQEELKQITRFIHEQGKLRFNPILDPIQNRIKTNNLYDGQVLVIDGGPGTGKTTSMIQRLKYLINLEAIKEDVELEEKAFNLSTPNRNLLEVLVNSNKDWVFFSPSELLKDYLADAMNREGFPNTNSRVHNWERY